MTMPDIRLAHADCFYCQVEQKRLGIPREVPCAVQQWAGLIAVNYAARAAGITRHMRVQEAMLKCPNLRLVHVQTLGGNVPLIPEGHIPTAGDVTAATEVSELAVSITEAKEQVTAVPGDVVPGGQGGQDIVEEAAGSRDKEKACLERYRQASAKIIGLLRQHAAQVGGTSTNPERLPSAKPHIHSDLNLV